MKSIWIAVTVITAQAQHTVWKSRVGAGAWPLMGSPRSHNDNVFFGGWYESSIYHLAAVQSFRKSTGALIWRSHLGENETVQTPAIGISNTTSKQFQIIYGTNFTGVSV